MAENRECVSYNQGYGPHQVEDSIEAVYLIHNLINTKN